MSLLKGSLKGFTSNGGKQTGNQSTVGRGPIGPSVTYSGGNPFDEDWEDESRQLKLIMDSPYMLCEEEYEAIRAQEFWEESQEDSQEPGPLKRAQPFIKVGTEQPRRNTWRKKRSTFVELSENN